MDFTTLSAFILLQIIIESQAQRRLQDQQTRCDNADAWAPTPLLDAALATDA